MTNKKSPLDGLADMLVLTMMGTKIAELEGRVAQLSAISSALVRRLLDGKQGEVYLTREEIAALEHSALRIELCLDSEADHVMPDLRLAVIPSAEADAERAEAEIEDGTSIEARRAKEVADAAIASAIYTSKTRH